MTYLSICVCRNQATGYARKDILRKDGMAEVRAPISLHGVAVHPDGWCICLYYLHFAPENPEDGKIYLLVPAQPGCPGQSPESCKMVVSVCLCVCVCVCAVKGKRLELSTPKLAEKCGPCRGIVRDACRYDCTFYSYLQWWSIKNTGDQKAWSLMEEGIPENSKNGQSPAFW